MERAGATSTIAFYGRFQCPVMSWFDAKPECELYARDGQTRRKST